MIQYRILNKLTIGKTLVGLTLEDKNTKLKYDISLDELKDSLFNKSISVDGLELNNDLELAWSIDISTSTELNKSPNIFLDDDELLGLIKSVESYNKRKQYTNIIDWIKSNKSVEGIILALYGLRRTGKTVLLLQTAQWLIDNNYKVAYGEIRFGTEELNLSNLVSNKIKQGYNAIIIDEITISNELMSNNILSDIYAKSGIKIIVAGTQSLMIKESSISYWYDRVEVINTTFISAKEFMQIYEGATFQDYIKFGGILSNSRLKDVGLNNIEYIKTSIIENIKHTLESNPESSSIRGIRESIERDEFDSILALLAETSNIQGLLSRLKKEYKSWILGSATQLYNKKIAKEAGYNDISTGGIPKSTIKLWNQNIQREFNIKSLAVNSASTHLVSQIVSTLHILDYITYYRTQSLTGSTDEILLNQPGIRYQQSLQIIHLINDIINKSVKSIDKVKLYKQILEDIEGRLIEESLAVNLIQLYSDDYDIYKYLGVQGEIDIVIQEKKSNKVSLIEVKRSTKIIPEHQVKWLVNNDLNSEIESKGLVIQSRYVMYLGTDEDIQYGGHTIQYRNIESFLKQSIRL